MTLEALYYRLVENCELFKLSMDEYVLIRSSRSPDV